MKQYADYSFYQNVFKGKLINSEDAFDRTAIEASLFLNESTLGRINEPVVIDEVKMAVCAVAEIIHKEYVQNNEDQIASESVGPHSVSYVKKIKTAEEYTKEKQKVVRLYLSGTGLLYRGIASCGF